MTLSPPPTPLPPSVVPHDSAHRNHSPYTRRTIGPSEQQQSSPSIRLRSTAKARYRRGLSSFRVTLAPPLLTPTRPHRSPASPLPECSRMTYQHGGPEGERRGCARYYPLRELRGFSFALSFSSSLASPSFSLSLILAFFLSYLPRIRQPLPAPSPPSPLPRRRHPIISLFLAHSDFVSLSLFGDLRRALLLL